MKNRALVAATLFVFSVMVAAQAARAGEPMLVNIPFQFVAGNTTLPAGQYRIQKLDNSAGVLVINCSDANASVMVATFPAQSNEPQTESKLIFNRYDNHYFLSQVWSAGSVRGRQLTKSPREKEITRVASIETKTEVTLVARLSPAKP